MPNICKVKAEQCGIRLSEISISSNKVVADRFFDGIEYTGCDEAEEMYYTGLATTEDNATETALVNMYHIIIGVMGGIILILILANAAYFTVKRCKIRSNSQVPIMTQFRGQKGKSFVTTHASCSGNEGNAKPYRSANRKSGTRRGKFKCRIDI